jgi:transcription termination factor NusA
MLSLEGMDKMLAAKLAGNGIKTRDDLADLAVDELTEMTGIDTPSGQTTDHHGACALVRVSGKEEFIWRKQVLPNLPPSSRCRLARCSNSCRRPVSADDRRTICFPSRTSPSCWTTCDARMAGRRQDQDHPDAQGNDRDQVAGLARQVAYRAGRGAQEARSRQARCSRRTCRSARLGRCWPPRCRRSTRCRKRVPVVEHPSRSAKSSSSQL